MPAMTTMPTHADAHAVFPVRDIRPHGIDDAHHFVARHPWILDAGKCAGDGEHVAVADAAGLHFDAHLAPLGIGYVTFDDFERGIGLSNLNSFHTFHAIPHEDRSKGSFGEEIAAVIACWIP